MGKNEQLAKLREYGFSEYSSRVYLALLDLGRADAAELSRQSRVPAAKIYAILRQLEEHGLVESHAGSPRRYVPRPFSAFLERVQNEQRERTFAIERDIEAAAQLFPRAAESGLVQEGNVRLVRGRRNVIEKWRAQLRGTKREFLILAGDGFSQRLPNLAPAFEEFVSRGGRARILVRDDPSMRLALRYVQGFAEVRSKEHIRTEHPDASITLFDRDSAMIAHLSSGSAGASGEDFAILTDLPTAVGLLADILHPHWDRAEPLGGSGDEGSPPRQP